LACDFAEPARFLPWTEAAFVFDGVGGESSSSEESCVCLIALGFLAEAPTDLLLCSLGVLCVGVDVSCSSGSVTTKVAETEAAGVGVEKDVSASKSFKEISLSEPSSPTLNTFLALPDFLGVDGEVGTGFLFREAKEAAGG